MAMEEVLKIKKQLEKVEGTKDDAKSALKLLKSLESIPMTLDVLQKTHIGMTVNKTRKKIDDSDFNSLCKSMLKKWKKLLDKTQHANNAGDNPKNAVSPPTSTTNTTQNTAKTSANNNNISVTSTTAKTANLTPTEVPHTTSEVRLKVRSMLSEALKKALPKELAEEAFHDEEVLAARIEDCIYQEFKDTGLKYKNRMRSRVSNLGDLKNPYLRLNVLRGDIAPERIAKMSAEEMASDELKREREKFTKEAINDHQMAHTSGTKTSEIKCPACKKFNVTYNQVQTRSADEPMTTFCFCNECGKRWKFC